jgi:hypothetical protein
MRTSIVTGDGTIGSATQLLLIRQVTFELHDLVVGSALPANLVPCELIMPHVRSRRSPATGVNMPTCPVSVFYVISVEMIRHQPETEASCGSGSDLTP